MRIAPTRRTGRRRFAGSTRETLPGDRAGAIKETGFGHERGKSLVPRHGPDHPLCARGRPSVPPSAPCCGPFRKSTLVPVRTSKENRNRRRCQMPALRATTCAPLQCLNTAPEVAEFTANDSEFVARRRGRRLASQGGAELFGGPAERGRQGRERARLAATCVEHVHQLPHGRQRHTGASGEL